MAAAVHRGGGQLHIIVADGGGQVLKQVGSIGRRHHWRAVGKVPLVSHRPVELLVKFTSMGVQPGRSSEVKLAAGISLITCTWAISEIHPLESVTWYLRVYVPAAIVLNTGSGGSVIECHGLPAPLMQGDKHPIRPKDYRSAAGSATAHQREGAIA
jgi:hypothetical protein